MTYLFRTDKWSSMVGNDEVKSIHYAIQNIADEIRNNNNLKDLDNINRELAVLMSLLKVKELHQQAFSVYHNILGTLRGWKVIDKYQSPERLPADLDDALDHAYVLRKYNGGQIICGEPYNLDMEELKKIITFCENNNLHFVIDGECIHFPNKTLRIKFYNKMDTLKQI